MIVDLKKQGRDMFVTESVAYINKGKDGLWTVRFATSGRFFKYNTSRLLYMTRPEANAVYTWARGALQTRQRYSALRTERTPSTG